MGEHGASRGATPAPGPLGELEAELRAILVPFEDVLVPAEIYGMEVLRRPGAKAHDWFAGVRPAADSVKFMLLPVHRHPELLEGLSPALRRRKTGASLFTVRAADSALLAELAELTSRAFERYAAAGSD